MLTPWSTSYDQDPVIGMLPIVRTVQQRYQSALDRLTPFPLYRWLALFGLTLFLMLRIILAKGYYVVAYALGIYLLNMLLLFLSPRFDPAFVEDQEADSLANDADLGASSSDLPSLPVQSGTDEAGEFRPFIRRLPEFKFWHEAFRAITIALVCSFIPLFDIPVFWPILLLYFILLFVMTMRRQISHMIKYQYVPFDWGKQSYQGGVRAAIK